MTQTSSSLQKIQTVSLNSYNCQILHPPTKKPYKKGPNRKISATTRKQILYLHEDDKQHNILALE